MGILRGPARAASRVLASFLGVATGKLERDQVFQRFYALIDSIPRGRVATYGQIAREAGLPRHARHVGHALRELPASSRLPWHRVLNARGEISPRPGGCFPAQSELLRAEGVDVRDGGRVDLERYRWAPEDP